MRWNDNRVEHNNNKMDHLLIIKRNPKFLNDFRFFLLFSATTAAYSVSGVGDGEIFALAFRWKNAGCVCNKFLCSSFVGEL